LPREEKEILPPAATALRSSQAPGHAAPLLPVPRLSLSLFFTGTLEPCCRDVETKGAGHVPPVTEM